MLEYNDENHTYRLDGVPIPSVTTVLADEGFIDSSFFTEESRIRGKRVHKIVAWHINGTLDESSVSEELAPYYEAWLLFERSCEWVPYLVETPMASEIYKFAGTPDQLGYMNGRKIVLDVKSGVISPVTGLQLAGYEALCNDGLMDRVAIQLMDTGKFKLTSYKERTDRGIMLGAIANWHWKRYNKIIKGGNNGRI